MRLPVPLVLILPLLAACAPTGPAGQSQLP